MIKAYAMLVVVIAALSGCATMDKSQCLTADWRTIGFEDGANGKPETAISEYRQDCADHGVAPDLTAYQRGHREGSERFCTTRNGFMVGKRGGSYNNSCPAQLEAVFLPAYNDGKELYSFQRALNAARTDVDRQHRLLERLEKDIIAKTDLLVEDGLVKEERVAILADIDALKREAVEAAHLLPQLERDVRRAEKAYLQAEQRFSHYQ